MTGDLLLLGLALFAATRRKPAPSTPGKTTPPAPARRPLQLRAMLYRTPADQYDTTRVAVEKAPGQAMEKRGIFANPKAAWEVVQKSGWKAAPEVQQLEADPK